MRSSPFVPGTLSARAEVVPEAGGERLEVAGQGAPGAAHAERLDQEHPDDELLPDDGLVEPLRRVERVQVGGQRRREDAAPDREQDHPEQVD